MRRIFASMAGVLFLTLLACTTAEKKAVNFEDISSAEGLEKAGLQNDILMVYLYSDG